MTSIAAQEFFDVLGFTGARGDEIGELAGSGDYVDATIDDGPGPTVTYND